MIFSETRWLAVRGMRQSGLCFGVPKLGQHIGVDIGIRLLRERLLEQARSIVRLAAAKGLDRCQSQRFDGIGIVLRRSREQMGSDRLDRCALLTEDGRRTTVCLPTR